jgi:hypothetical protein
MMTMSLSAVSGAGASGQGENVAAQNGLDIFPVQPNQGMVGVAVVNGYRLYRHSVIIAARMQRSAYPCNRMPGRLAAYLDYGVSAAVPLEHECAPQSRAKIFSSG